MNQVSLNVPAHGFALADMGMNYNPQRDVCFGSLHNGELVGGAIVSDFTGMSTHLHTVGFKPGWMTRPLLWATFTYIFRDLGCVKAFAVIDSDNTPAIELARRVGLKEEARLLDMFPHGDGVVLGMYRDECKWIQLKTPPKHLFLENDNGAQLI